MIPAIGSVWCRAASATSPRLFDSCVVLEVFALRDDLQHPRHASVCVRRPRVGMLVARCLVNTSPRYISVTDLFGRWAPTR